MNIHHHQKNESSLTLFIIRLKTNKDSVSVSFDAYSSGVKRTLLKAFCLGNIHLVVKGGFQQPLQGSMADEDAQVLLERFAEDRNSLETSWKSQI